MTKNGKSCLSGVLGLIAVAMMLFMWQCNSCNEKTEEELHSSKAESIISSPILSSSDSAQLLKSLTDINSRIDRVHVISEKANSQYKRIAGVYAEGMTSDYTLYQAAEIAKNHMDRARETIRGIDVPDKLPKPLQDTLNLALSGFSTYYFTMSDAFEIAMDVANGNSDYSLVKRYQDKCELAEEEYRQALLNLFTVESSMGMKPRQRKKLRKHSA
jgi:hypothetical protein